MICGERFFNHKSQIRNRKYFHSPAIILYNSFWILLVISPGTPSLIVNSLILTTGVTSVVVPMIMHSSKSLTSDSLIEVSREEMLRVRQMWRTTCLVTPDKMKLDFRGVRSTPPLTAQKLVWVPSVI